MAKQLFFDDFTVGDRYGSPSRTITDSHFLFFSALTYDRHPLHYDVEYAKHTRFGRPVAHGLLLASLTALGGSELAEQFEAAVIAFLEQSTRFRGPVFVGDTISPALEVAELIPKGEDRGVIKFRSTLTNQRGEIVLEGEHVYLVKRHEA